MNKIRVAVNGYGVIGRRVADAVTLQEDMEVAGVADIEGWAITNITKTGGTMLREQGWKLGRGVLISIRAMQIFKSARANLTSSRLGPHGGLGHASG
jgi:glyceraldehyde-3-phosphate dehydrogenase/erythrose-4-phosphate dehydrogenase